MHQGKYSRALLTFAFVKQEFEQSRDVIRGLMPLFAPIFSSMSGSIFSPTEFSEKVEAYYGLRMHPYVAEDWVSRFEDAGYVVAEGDRFTKTYRCVSANQEAGIDDASDIGNIVDELVDYTESRLRDHQLQAGRSEIEESIVSRLCKAEFISLLSKPQKNFTKNTTLTLKDGNADDEVVNIDSAIDFILTDRLLVLSRENKKQFERIADIAGGALVDCPIRRIP
jgi:hypothetical protein